MREHWLKRIPDIFASESDDLKELARIAGYDPKTFYRGTLPEDQIEQLFGQQVRSDENGDGGYVHIQGDLGIASAWLPVGTDNLTVQVQVFQNEIALLEHYFNGKFDGDVVAVVLSPLHIDKSLKNLTPALELLQRKGFSVLLMIEGPITLPETPIPVIANFAEKASRNGVFGTLSEGDFISLTVKSGYLKLTRKMGRKIPPIGDTLSVEKAHATRKGDRAPDLWEVLRYQNYLIENALSLATKNRRRSELSPIVHALEVFAGNIDRLVHEFEVGRPRQNLSYYTEDVGLLRDHLTKAALIARRGGNTSVALAICITHLRVLNELKNAGGDARPFDVADVHLIMGDAWARAGSHREASTEYRCAFEIVRHESSGFMHNEELTRIVKITHKLALAVGKLDQLDEEAHYLAMAAEYLSRMDGGFEEREFRELKGNVLFDKANMSLRCGYSDDAFNECSDAIDAYQSLRTGRYTINLATKLARAYRLQSEICLALDRVREGILAGIVALNFSLHFLEVQTSQKSRADGFRALIRETASLQESLFSRIGPRHPHWNDEVIVTASRALAELKPENSEHADEHEFLKRIHQLRVDLWHHFPGEVSTFGFYP